MSSRGDGDVDDGRVDDDDGDTEADEEQSQPALAATRVRGLLGHQSSSLRIRIMYFLRGLENYSRPQPLSEVTRSSISDLFTADHSKRAHGPDRHAALSRVRDMLSTPVNSGCGPQPREKPVGIRR